MDAMEITDIRRNRLKEWIAQEYGGKVAEFVRRHNLPPSRESYISQLLSGYRNVGEKAARKLEDEGGKPRGWLDLPLEGVAQPKNRLEEQAEADMNVSPGPDIRGKVPLISWVQAGDFAEVVDLLHPGEAFEWIETTVQPRVHTFALRVHNDSMEPLFPAGTILIVEPELDAHAGDYVIAKNGDEEATFKQLVRDGGDWYLKPLNPRYPLKPFAGCHVVGVVRAAEHRFR